MSYAYSVLCQLGIWDWRRIKCFNFWASKHVHNLWNTYTSVALVLQHLLGPQAFSCIPAPTPNRVPHFVALAPALQASLASLPYCDAPDLILEVETTLNTKEMKKHDNIPPFLHLLRPIQLDGPTAERGDGEGGGWGLLRQGIFTLEIIMGFKVLLHCS
jgi:hypothetical protein